MPATLLRCKSHVPLIRCWAGFGLYPGGLDFPNGPLRGGPPQSDGGVPGVDGMCAHWPARLAGDVQQCGDIPSQPHGKADGGEL